MEIETTYSVQYQKDSESTWWEFTGDVFQNPVGRLHNETHDMEHAQSVAARLFDGDLWTDSRLKYRANVTATRVMQQIYAGGTLITFGNPQSEKEAAETGASCGCGGVGTHGVDHTD